MKKYIKSCFRLTVKDLSKHKDSIEPDVIEIARNPVNAYGLDWDLYMRIKQEKSSNENEKYFDVFLCASQNPSNQ